MLPAGDRIDTVLARCLTGTVRASADGSMRSIFPIAIPANEGEALSAWVAREGASSTIEIGLGYGVSALFILRGLLAVGPADFRHVAIDPNQTRFANVGLQLIDEAGLRDHVEFYEEPSEVVLPRLFAEGRAFDFAFVDGNHRFDWVFVDLVYLGRSLRGGSVIFLDDYQLPAIRKAVAFFLGDLGWTIEDEGAADDRHHWVVLRTAAQARERTFEHFVDF